MLEYIMLGFLMDGELSGYDLKQRMLRSTSNFFDASFGSIYPALKKMEAKGTICSREVVEGSKYKKLYAITETGQSEFITWLDQPIELSKTKPDHLVKVFFLGFLPKDKAISKLKAFMAEVEAVSGALKEAEAEIKEIADTYQFSTLVFGIDYYQLIINWCGSLLNHLEKV